MTDLGIRLTVLLNQIANLLGQILLMPLGVLPELAGAIVVAVFSGIVMLIAFKYTSPQATMKRVRSGIKAELLALSLFKDNIAVNLRSQAKIILGALKSVLISLVPVAIMMIPVTLLLGQLSLWWQARPVHAQGETVVTLNLAGNEKSPFPKVELLPSSAVETTLGPVQIRSKRAVCWNLQARQTGYHELKFQVGDQTFEKQLAIGDHPMRVSMQRPGWKWTDVVLNPAEAPFDPQSPVKSIEIEYSESSSWATGSQTWIVFWFVGSMIAAFCFRGVFNVTL